MGLGRANMGEVIAGKETILGSQRRTIARFIKEEFTNADWAPG